MDNFIPVLRFMVVSDIHIRDEHSVERERFEKAIRIANRIAAGNERYNKLDAIAVVGDFATSGTETQMLAAKKIIDENKNDNTRLIISVASHEYHNEGGVPAALKRLKDIFDTDPETHDVINGFHFLSLSPSEKCNYNDKKKKWMSENLKLAAEDDPKKPIFVFQHPHNTGSVYGSMLWGEDDLISTYMDYPQIIHFSGHSHAPINDPRSIHQQHVTCIGTGTLSYFEMDEFDKGTTLPERKDEAAQMTLVEADKDGRVRIFPYDVLTDNYFPYVWEIERPWDRSCFKYTWQRYKTAQNPYFDETSEIKTVSAGHDFVEITFPQAKSIGDPYVNSYDIVIKNADGKVVRTVSIWSGYYLYNMPEHLTVKIDKLGPDTRYRAEITANGFWFNSSEKPLTGEICTK